MALQRFAFVARTIKLTETLDDMRDVFAGGLDIVQMLFSIIAQAGLGLGDEIGKTDDWAKGRC